MKTTWKVTKKTLCKKYACDEQKHDALIEKLIQDEDPEVMKMMKESQKMWEIFRPRNVDPSAVPAHLDEDTSIEYITRSFELVKNAMIDAKEAFVQEGKIQSTDELRTAMSSNKELSQEFNTRFAAILSKSKKALMTEFKIKNEEIAAALVAKYQSSPKFTKAISEAKMKMDKYFQQ